MTARAKKSRVASDFASIATALETYKMDWSAYPVDAGTALASGSKGYSQLAGTDTATGNGPNFTGATTAAGDTGAIVYLIPNILASMKNPYTNANDYKYTSAAGATWRLSADTADGTTNHYLVRQDTAPTVVASPTA